LCGGGGVFSLISEAKSAGEKVSWIVPTPLSVISDMLD